MGWVKLALCCVVLAGCRTEVPRDPVDAGTDGATCAELARQATDFAAAHQSCEVNSDCTGEAPFGFIYDMGNRVSCWPPVVISTDAVGGFMSLMDQMLAAKCEGPSQVCSALQPEGKCNQHVCGSR